MVDIVRLTTELRTKNHTVSVVETGAGGLISSALVAEPGASAWFREGVVAYSHSSKTFLLPAQTIAEHGSVSHQAAKDMAEHIRIASGSTIGLCETSVIGPTGGSPQKPVGLTIIGLSVDGSPAITFEYRHNGNRVENMREAMWRALEVLQRWLDDQDRYVEAMEKILKGL
jgi:PncC family amidohydrolase